MGIAVVVVVLIITPRAIATAWPRRLTTQERHTTPPGTARPGVGASEARAAMYASLPPLSQAPLNRHWFVRLLPTLCQPVSRIAKIHHSIPQDRTIRDEVLRQKTANYDVALTGSVPPRMVGAATPCHADSSDVPFGRSSTLLRAYTVNR